MPGATHIYALGSRLARGATSDTDHLVVIVGGQFAIAFAPLLNAGRAQFKQTNRSFLLFRLQPSSLFTFQL